METKLSKVKAKFLAGDLQGALRIAAKFADLGDHRDAILKAHEAFNYGDFYKQLGNDPAALIEAGRIALAERYGFQS